MDGDEPREGQRKVTAQQHVVAVDLGDAGRAWIRKSLTKGFELSHAVMQTHDLSKGDVYGYYPPGTAWNNITRFEGTLFSKYGSLPAALAGDSEDAAILSTTEIDDVLLLETAIRKSEFPHPRNNPLLPEDEVLLLPHDVVALRRVRGATVDDLGSFLSADGGYDNVFVVKSSSLPEAAAIDVDRLARAVRAVLVPAYDSESVIVWKPWRLSADVMQKGVR